MAVQRSLLVLVVVSLAAAAWVAPGSAEGAPDEVTITTTQVCLGDTPPASFEAEGALRDTGRVDYTLLGPEAGQYGLTGHTLKTEALLTGVHGTLTLRWDVMFKTTDDPDVVGEFGQWHVVAGTGEYAGITGQGRSSGFCDLRGGLASEIQVLEGRVH